MVITECLGNSSLIRTKHRSARSGFLIREAIGHARELDEVLSAIECQRGESFIDHRESDCRTLQLECHLRDYGFTSQR